MSRRVLISRLDSAGDVLLSGPAVRAVSTKATEIVYLCGERGASAARLLPGIDRLMVRTAEWIDPEPRKIEQVSIQKFVTELAALEVDEALVLSSYHQSSLPLALLLKMAGIPIVAAISTDYPGSLLDVRCLVDEGLHEVERSLELVSKLGYQLASGDPGDLRIKDVPAPSDQLGLPAGEFIVLHPGTSVPARAWSPSRMRHLRQLLVERGYRVVVTGSASETQLANYVAETSLNLAGRTSFADLAGVLRQATAVVVANTGPAHLAAAVGTPVVSLFAPTVPVHKWRPWQVPYVVLGEHDIKCAGCRAKICPVRGHPCIDDILPTDVADAIESLLPLGTAQR